VLELARSLDERPELVTWRQGRCLPYGEGISFWALSEIAKSHAGILDSDDVCAAEKKLEAVLPEGEDRAWLRQRLRALIGLEAAQASREESFAAWRRFLESIAETGMTVLVLEDLHWADEAMLAFIEYLAENAPSGPISLLATTRPELLEQHPSVLATGSGVQRLSLAPLPENDTATLLETLLQGKPAGDGRHRLVELVAGNPLYAEQYARLVLERAAGTSTPDGLGNEPTDALPLPDTVQAVIAARLDSLPPSLKAFLCASRVHCVAGG
jgi:predicted ATPase